MLVGWSESALETTEAVDAGRGEHFGMHGREVCSLFGRNRGQDPSARSSK